VTDLLRQGLCFKFCYPPSAYEGISFLLVAIIAVWISLDAKPFSHFHQCEIDFAHVRQPCEIFLSHTAVTSFDCDVTYFL
jgi:hypothetical protein